jgi:hypothetical protein
MTPVVSGHPAAEKKRDTPKRLRAALSLGRDMLPKYSCCISFFLKVYIVTDKSEKKNKMQNRALIRITPHSSPAVYGVDL